MVDAVKYSKHSVGAGEACVHQALHGYSEGHRLIESSIQLPHDIARLMLRMSDLSGSNVGPGFEDYITGYPLTSIGMYALAKTWYAQEMPRPGCVWTHTLLIPDAQLATPSLAIFLALFRRPQQRASNGPYSGAIHPDQWINAESSVSAGIEPHRDAARFLTFFYCKEAQPILIPAKTSRDYEQMLFATWSQQWPALRRCFTFSTGSLSARSFGNRPFDVQCVPVALVRDVQLETIAMQCGEPVTIDATSVELPEWATVVAEDTRIASGGEVRTFLWKIADPTSGRLDFAAFMQIYEALHRPNELGQLISLVAELFPQSSHSIRLKKLLFGEQRQRTFLSQQDETSILSALGSSNHHAAFDAISLRLKERGETLSRDYRSARRLIGELFRSPLNPLGGEILAGLISALDSRAAREITSEQPQLLSALVAAKPSLATSSQLWVAAGDRKRELFESIVRHKNLDSAVVGGIISALLESRSDNFIRRAVDEWGKDAVFATLDWVVANGGVLTESSRGALTFHVNTVMDWVQASPEKSLQALLTAAHIVAPYSYQIWERDTRRWNRAFDEVQGRFGDPDALYLCTFLLALGLGNAPPDPLTLVGNCFELVYRAASNDQLDDSTWEILDPIVPHLSWPNDWDKCERMRRGLISAFIQHHWPPSELYHRISYPDILSRLPKSAEKVDGGKAFLQTLPHSVAGEM